MIVASRKRLAAMLARALGFPPTVAAKAESVQKLQNSHDRKDEWADDPVTDTCGAFDAGIGDVVTPS